jgi:hypothetical protein
MNKVKAMNYQAPMDQTRLVCLKANLLEFNDFSLLVFLSANK